MKSMLVITLLAVLIAFYQNANDSNEKNTESLRVNKASLFLNYTSAFDVYYNANVSANGDVTSKVVLPVWMPANNMVKMYISSGNGYVYMPLESGVFSEIAKATDYSALVGISDSSVIKTSSGTIAKPAFIPSGYVVYVR